MLTVADNLSTFQLGAGEPFLLQVEFQDKDGAPVDLGARAFVLSFYRADRSLERQLDGVQDSDSKGQFLRFEEDGAWSERLYGAAGLKVELAERYLRGRNVIAAGTLTIAMTAASVPSLGNAPIGTHAVRVAVKDAATSGGAPAFSQHKVPWAAQGFVSTPTPGVPAFTTPPSISPATGTAGVTTFTASDGAASNASGYTRRWLLSGTAIGTGATIKTDAAGSLVLEVTAHGPGGDSAPALASAAVEGPAYLGQVATRSAISNNYNPNLKQLRGRSAHFKRGSSPSLTLGFTNTAVRGILTQAGDFGMGAFAGVTTIVAAIEYPAGVYTPAMFSGSRTGTMDSGNNGASQLALSAPVAVDVPNGAMFWVRYLLTGAEGVVFQDGSAAEIAPVQGANLNEFCEGGNGELTDNTLGGSYANNVSSVRYSPILILGQTTASSVLIVGDSRANGAHDTADSSGDLGNAARSIGAALGYSAITAGGYSAQNFIAGHDIIGLIAPYFSHVISNLGGNDLNHGDSAATVLSRMETIWSYFPGNKVGQLTVEPFTSSTDGWGTTANQSPQSQAPAAQAVNEALRAGYSGVTVYDIAAAVETAVGSGIWKSPGYTIDGVHATRAGYLLAANSGRLSPGLLRRSS